MLSRAIRRRTRAKALLASSSSRSSLDNFGLYIYKCPHNRHNSTSLLFPNDLPIEGGHKPKASSSRSKSNTVSGSHGDRDGSATADTVKRRYAGLVNALKVNSKTSGRVRLKPVLLPPALSGGPYNADDAPSFGPDYRSEEPSSEGATLAPSLPPVEGSDSQRTICVFGISLDTPEDAVRAAFRAFGRIRALSLPLPPPPTPSGHKSVLEDKHKTTYVTYHSADSVTKALQQYATTSGIFVRGQEVHLHRHMKGAYLPVADTEGHVIGRLRDLVNGEGVSEGKEEDSQAEEGAGVKASEESLQRDPVKTSFRTPPFPQIIIPVTSGSPSSSPDKYGASATEPSTKKSIWDLPLSEAKAVVAKAVVPFMRLSTPSRHLNIYGAPRQWFTGDMGIWLSDWGTLTRITDGTSTGP